MSALLKLPMAWQPPSAARWISRMQPKKAELAMASARQEGVQRVAEAEKRAQMAAEEIKANAQAEAARIIAQAKADAEQQVGKARDELRNQVAGLAVKGAEQILRREVDPKAHAALLDQLKAEL